MPLYVEPGYWEPGYAEGDEESGLTVIVPPTTPRLMLWETLPLRTTRALGDYAEDQPLPHVFGDLRNSPFKLIRLSSTRYFASDGDIHIDAAFVDRQKVLDWESTLESDADGNAWTEVRFAAPVPDAAVVWATATGKRDPDSDELIENPADVAEWIFRLAGRDDDLSQLRAECSRLDLRVAGRIFETKAIKDHIDDVLQSVGAIWCPGMARLYPTTSDGVVLDLDRSEVENVKVSASLVDTADVLRLSFNRSDGRGKPLAYIELTASPKRYNGVTKEVAYNWLRTHANAESVGRPVMQRLAGERYDVEFDSSRLSLRPGMEVRLVDNREWPLDTDDPVITVLSIEPNRKANRVHVTGECMIGDRPNVTITAHSIALPDTTEAGLDVTVRDGIATFTATDEDGKPIAGARVSLDGGEAKTTDAQGKVRFTVTSGGLHEVAFEAPGFSPVTLQVLL